ncbi:hypothetical protein M972_112758 [Acetivibrio thermocellus AD2]|jgi:hypothetical protein|uniref:Uncharacterized protein n=1 Tax=Acetivibrio thermocellus AD2 TaxID=1138384 RepID=A0AB36TJ92_ACETH|nr:hypothetical protein AD2_02676 [Acetivibrio thermocellus AD2]ANV77429.1 hypothetical protein LQRI_2688 [Acetivibrio thermocellus DSM 2360]PFH03939.1 hypothetical protein M972_112758 [Acetivibrio thermocellus AD2]SOD22850.1 hypothetical protein SAMN04515622_0839 [Acetivibrio thermocellus]
MFSLFHSSILTYLGCFVCLNFWYHYKADIDILRILNKYYYLVVEFKFVSEDMILLDVSAFTNVADAVKREGE